MEKFDKEFIMEMFLDSDTTTTINRLVVAIANVVTENSENSDMFTEVINKEFPQAFKGAREAQCNSYATRKRKKVYYEDIILNFTDEEYLEKFKMRKRTVQLLIDFLKDFVPGGTIVPLDKKVHVFLLVLTSDLSFNEVGNLFGLHKSSVSYVFYEIASMLAEQQYHFINWPSVEEQDVTRIKVNSYFKFPNCVGFIDVCRFKVGSKRNKKNKPETILLQAVCDESLQFIDIHIGDIGTTRKSKVYKESTLSHELKNFVHSDNHILGDSDYKLKKNLITPYTSEEILTKEEMKFNEIHWKARSYIGQTFELLKEQFQKLNHIDISKADAVKTLICAACVLHNFVLLHEGSPQVKDEPITYDDAAVTIDPDIVKTAVEKRQFLCNYINYIDAT